MKSLQNKVTDKRTGDLTLCFDYEDVKEAVLDYSNLSKNWRKNNNTEKMLFKKYNLNDDMSLEDCYIKIFGDFEK